MDLWSVCPYRDFCGHVEGFKVYRYGLKGAVEVLDRFTIAKYGSEIYANMAAMEARDDANESMLDEFNSLLDKHTVFSG